MKDGKLEMSDVGKRFRILGTEHWFKPLGLSEDGKYWIGEGPDRRAEAHPSNWLFMPFEETKVKKRVEAAPAVSLILGKPEIPTNLYGSEEEARRCLGGSFVAWPAPFDPVRGVYYYEREE